MGAKDDCKHGIDVEAEFYGKAYLLEFVCHKCHEEFTPDDIVILTKAQHALMWDVIEAGRIMRDSQLSSKYWDAREKYYDALEALQGGK